MALSTSARQSLNRVLSLLNLRLDTLTAERREQRRRQALVERGHFAGPAFPVPDGFRLAPIHEVMAEVAAHATRFKDFTEPMCNDVGYTFANDYFSSPDAEVLYALVRRFRPTRIVEVGSGHSTRVMRQAILDEGLSTRVIAIDPRPRVDVTSLCDEVWRRPVEDCPSTLFEGLGENDVLFVDSSHTILPGNDVIMLHLQVMPRLHAGVLVHIHDVFLPWEYPEAWLVNRGWDWNEQYLVQALLGPGGGPEVLWPGHFAQRTIPDFNSYFPHRNGRAAQSLWLRTTARARATAGEAT
jgi:hypothetical protein